MVYASIATGLATAFCWGTADYMSRSQSERVGYYRTIIYSHMITLMVVLALIPIISPKLAFPVYPVLALIGAGVINFAAFVFLYRAFHRGVVSVVAPVVYTYPAVTAVLAVVILGASLSVLQVVALAGIIAGVILLSTRFSELRAYLRGAGAPRLTKGVGLAVGASLCFGMVYIGIGYAAPSVSVVLPVIFLRIIAISAGFLLAPVLRQEAKPSRLVISKTMIAMGVLEAFGFLAFTYGIEAAGSALPVVTALSGMGGAVATSYGLVFLKERLEPNQLLGVLLSLAGVFVLLYLGG
ncbi:MAG TPA: DMT family transporter [Nitrososphaerales archaeon]|nr:DMT family transporter [Nitrososphaerales archaeon]